jgi:hypothetical protein
MGPDGLLYIVSLSEGAIFRIVPKAFAQQAGPDNTMMLYLFAAAAAAAAAYFIRRRR